MSIRFRFPHSIMNTKKLKRPTDFNQRAKFIVDIATEEIKDEEEDLRNPHAVALGSLGASKGGKARAEKLTPEERKRISQMGVQARK
jgi:hypothetical protein